MTVRRTVRGLVRVRDVYMYREERRALCVKYGFQKKHADVFRGKWTRTRANAKKKGVLCLLTFEEYLRKAARAGITRPEQIGRGSEDYHLCRKKDIGDYTVKNCAFKKAKVNLREKIENGGAAVTESEILSRIKKTYVVTSPKGKTYRGKNLSRFCAKHGLTATLMSRVCNQHLRAHKGWTGKYDAFIDMVEEELI